MEKTPLDVAVVKKSATNDFKISRCLTALMFLVLSLIVIPSISFACTLTSVSASGAYCTGTAGSCVNGDKIALHAVYSGGDCPSIVYLQVDAGSTDSSCQIHDQDSLYCLYSSSIITGMTMVCQGFNQFDCYGNWTIPYVPGNCIGKTVFANNASIKTGYSCSGGVGISGYSVFPSNFGSFTFSSTPVSTCPYQSNICTPLGYAGGVCVSAMNIYNGLCSFCQCGSGGHYLNLTNSSSSGICSQVPSCYLPVDPCTACSGGYNNMTQAECNGLGCVVTGTGNGFCLTGPYQNINETCDPSVGWSVSGGPPGYGCPGSGYGCAPGSVTQCGCFGSGSPANNQIFTCVSGQWISTAVCAVNACVNGQGGASCSGQALITPTLPPGVIGPPPSSITAPIPAINQTDFILTGYGWALPLFSPMFIYTVILAFIAGIGAKFGGVTVGGITALALVFVFTVFGIYPAWIGVIMVLVGGFIFVKFGTNILGG
jgi:hypothetical protein